ncbi:hypothetical protein [Halorubrum trueperi]|uniref:MBL fold metallo-hydrolase n=1 Tax=Halorubrum trueperi TaxID=2004704 RepID=A0ABD5UL07_9EURY
MYAGYPDSGFLSWTVRPPLWNHKGAFHRVLSRFVGLESPVRTVADGDRIGGFIAYHTPGHNPGHMVYLHESRYMGALGDLVRTKTDALLPPFWFDSYDLDALRTSVRELVERAPAFAFACPGHGKPLLAGNEALHALAARI